MDTCILVWCKKLSSENLQLEKVIRFLFNYSLLQTRLGEGPFTIGRIVYNFRIGVRRAGLNRPEYSPYWLMHTFNTRSLDNFPAETVRLMMGHKTEAMTRRYMRPDTESLRNEARKIRGMMPDA